MNVNFNLMYSTLVAHILLFQKILSGTLSKSQKVCRLFLFIGYFRLYLHCDKSWANQMKQSWQIYKKTAVDWWLYETNFLFWGVPRLTHAVRWLFLSKGNFFTAKTDAPVGPSALEKGAPYFEIMQQWCRRGCTVNLKAWEGQLIIISAKSFSMVFKVSYIGI